MSNLTLVIPTLDSEISAFISLASELKEMGIRLFLPTKEQYDMRSKIRLAEICEKSGLDFPRTKIITDVEVLYQLSGEISLPYVLKGIFYGASVVHSMEEALAAFYRTTAQWGLPVIIQEFLEGEEYDIVAVGDGSGQIVGALPMKKTFLTDKGKGWAGVIAKDPRLLEITKKFCHTTKWRGPCEVEVLKTRDKRSGRPGHQKQARPGDLILTCGGRVGKDGIHGVTASSEVASPGTPAGHVQIGDPYTQKKMHDFLNEARDLGLIRFITDCGGGGLSSAIGESARMAGGAEVWLDQVPLKYAGLDPWEIWVSESQERMVVGVAPDEQARFQDLALKHEVEVSVIGRYTDRGALEVRHQDRACAYMDLAFLEEEFPPWEFEAQWLPPEARLTEPVLGEVRDHAGLLLKMLDRPNLCSREWIARQYDHEVQGTSVIKPLLGRQARVPAPGSRNLRVR